MIATHVFQLSVRRTNNLCTFELSGDNVPRKTCELAYPAELDKLYQAWQAAYLGYYQRLRGEKVLSGQVSSTPPSAPVDYRKRLVEIDAQLLDTFYRWLRSSELHGIRSTIAAATHRTLGAEPHRVDVCLRCFPLDLARLPWETWEIGKELGVPRRIRIAREPQNIQESSIRPIRRRARILAILGNDGRLNLQKDIQAINALYSVARVEVLECQDESDPAALRQTICEKIADPAGWDILFFAGHSNESSSLTGGELRVTRNVSLFVKDIAPSLKIAQQKGLQFAVFNSCRGLNIAESLIDLGLSQVAIMREPIHDRVAHVFIQQFLASLSEYKDVHEALLDACECLKQQEHQLDFPSAHWVPSLFRHPNAELFRIQPFGLRHKLKRRFPTRGEAIGLAACLLTSVLPPVQDLLLDGRLWVQALNRQLTGDIPAQVESPILLVKVDPLSLKEAGIKAPRPIPQDYLASLVDAATERNAAIVGIDYLLDDGEGEPTLEQRARLKEAIETATQNQTQLVFAYDQNERSEYTDQGFISGELIPFDQARHGDINFYLTLLDLPASGTSCGSRKNICPFSYELARLYTQLPSSQALQQPSVSSVRQASNLLSLGYLSASASPPSSPLAPQSLFGITSFSENFLQAWFHPIVDFSLPPDRAYRTISACELLNQCTGEGNTFKDLANAVVVIAPGGYKEAGIEESDDNLPPPAALSVWRQDSFTGGDVHAYMLHHFLANHRVYPVPDLWMILLMAVLAKELRLHLLRNLLNRQRWAIALGLPLGYGFVCLQVFGAIGIVVPIVLPVTVIWLYFYLACRSGRGGRRADSGYGLASSLW
ncbi:MAG: CHASE2 domain-containing protein [Cyanobacteria bacterium P01_F01_bin.150]